MPDGSNARARDLRPLGTGRVMPPSEGNSEGKKRLGLVELIKYCLGRGD